MAFLPAIGEALIVAVSSIPAIWALHYAAGKNVLSVALASCVALAGIIRVLAAGIRQTSDTTATDRSIGQESCRLHRGKTNGDHPEHLPSIPSGTSAGDRGRATGSISNDSTDRRAESAPTDASVGAISTIPFASGGSSNSIDCSEGDTDAYGDSKQRKTDAEPNAVATRKRPYRRGGEVLYIAQGVAEAVVGIVRDPVRGALGEGPKGLVKGIGSGVIGVVGRPIRGVARAGHNAWLRIGVARGRSGGHRGSVASMKKPLMQQDHRRNVPNGDGAASESRVSVEGGDNSTSAGKGTFTPNEDSDCAACAAPLSDLETNKILTEQITSSYEGMVVGIVMVPLVVSSLFLLANQRRLDQVDHDSGPTAGIEEEVCLNGEFGVLQLPPSNGGISNASSTTDKRLVILLYLEALLDGSMLCAVSEAVYAIQRFIRAEGGRSLLCKFFASGPLRLTLLTAACVTQCRRPLLALWCLAVYDILRRLLESGNGRVARTLSLRSGEAAALAQAIALWAVDAVAYTFQELWVPNAAAWEEMFPRVPARSGGAVIVQTGLLGTLSTGLFVAAARSLMPIPWLSNLHGHILTYIILISGTAMWLFRWTAPLLGSNPVSWTLRYALGFVPQEAAPSHPGHFDAHGDAAKFRACQWWYAPRGLLSLDGIWWSLSGVEEFGEFNTLGGVAVEEGICVYRPLLVVGWVLALAVVVPLIPWTTKRTSLTKCASRKVFHLLATAMFVPAIATEREFLSLALGVALGVLVVLECLRCAGCPPLAGPIDIYFHGFLDERDKGSVVVTHLFLLLGCAIPLWVSGILDEPGVFPYTGVVAVGIGDAMGAVVGSNFGRHDWPGSRRTLEGSVAVFLSSLAGLVVATCCLLGERTEGRAGWAQATARLAWPVALTSLMEAFTSQVDNLVLPCVLLSSLALSELHRNEGAP